MRARKHETLAAAAGRIIELQDDPGHGVFLKFHVLADPADTDEEALRVFHYDGVSYIYGIRRKRAN
jgi:hypothetical protein